MKTFTLPKGKKMLAIMGISLSILGCKKDLSSPGRPQGPADLKTLSSAPQLTFYTLGVDILESDFLINPDDAAYEKFNHLDYALTLCLLELYNNQPALLQNLMQNMQSTPNKVYNLYAFADANPQVNAIFNNIFASRFNDFSSFNNNWRDYMEANYVYDESYEPYISFANQGTINFNATPYIAAPLEISERKFPNFSDELPMWLKINNKQYFTTLNEQTAAGITNPILLVTNARVGLELKDINLPVFPDPVVSPMSCGLPTPPAPHVHEKIATASFKINERYEGALEGKSDYTFVYAASKTYSRSSNTWGNYPGTVVKKEKGVKKSDIGKTISFDVDVFYPDYYSSPFCIDIQMLTLSALYNSNFIVAAYEHDWYASAKDLFKIKNTSGVLETWQAKRKFENEWYFFDPATNDAYPFAARNPAPNSEYVNYTKGELRLKRQYL